MKMVNLYFNLYKQIRSRWLFELNIEKKSIICKTQAAEIVEKSKIN